MSYVLYYQKSRNTNGDRIGGAPLRSLTQADLDALTPWDRAAVEASRWWRKPAEPKLESDGPDEEQEVTPPAVDDQGETEADNAGS